MKPTTRDSGPGKAVRPLSPRLAGRLFLLASLSHQSRFFFFFLLTLPAQSVTPTGIYEHLESYGYDLGIRREWLAAAPGFPAEITQHLGGISIRK